MKALPQTDDSPVLRTGFGDDDAWNLIRDAITAPSDEGFEAYVSFIDDRAFKDLSIADILKSLPEEYPHGFIIVADAEAIASPDHPLLTHPHFRVGLYRGHKIARARLSRARE
jgi:hypothetical protein